MVHLPINTEKKKGMRTLFMIQIFSTLSFSVLYSTLIIYITKGLQLHDSSAVAITGSFVAFNYFLHLLGGYIGGRYLSYRTLFSLGMLLQIIGCTILSLNSIDSLYWGLAAFLTGCGLNVTCINCMLTQLFEPHDKNRESAFFWNYSGMNIGFLIGFTISGLYQFNNYSNLFLVAGIGNIIALIIIFTNWKVLKDKDTYLSHIKKNKHFFMGIIGVALVVTLFFALYWLVKHSLFSNNFILIVGGLMVSTVALLALQQKTKQMAKKMWGFFILLLASLIFWTLYQMAPMGLTLFILNNVDRHFFSYLIPVQWINNVNTIIIIIGGPLMARLSNTLRSQGYTISIPFQFMLSLFFIGIGFVILSIGIYFAGADGKTSYSWIIVSFILQSIGELLISPVGYAMIGQLIPNKFQGLMMGTWLMITGVAATISNYFSQMSIDSSHTKTIIETNKTFSESFSILGWSAILGGIILLCLLPFLKKLIQEKQPHNQPHPYNAPEDTPH